MLPNLKLNRGVRRTSLAKIRKDFCPVDGLSMLHGFVFIDLRVLIPPQQ